MMLIFDKPEDQVRFQEIVKKAVAEVLANQPKEVPQQDDEIMTRAQAAKYFGTCPNTISTWWKKGKINGQRMGGSIVFLKSDLMRAARGGKK